MDLKTWIELHETVDEAAAILGVSRSSIYRYRRLPALKTVKHRARSQDQARILSLRTGGKVPPEAFRPAKV
jgi:hypothetical protein